MPNSTESETCGSWDAVEAKEASTSSNQSSKDKLPSAAFDPDTYYTWRLFWKRFFNIISDEDNRRYQQSWSIKNQEELCERCNKYRDWMFKNSPTIVFMNDNLRKLGADLDASTVLCRICDSMSSRLRKGAWSPKLGILLCANHLSGKGDLEDVLAHEMVHAYDYMRFQFDAQNLKHLACTEIRAATLSGECRFIRQFWTHGNYKFTAGFQDCVKRKAIGSIRRHDACEDEAHAARVIKEVWGSCFRDTRPFDEIYR